MNVNITSNQHVLKVVPSVWSIFMSSKFEPLTSPWAGPRIPHHRYGIVAVFALLSDAIANQAESWPRICLEGTPSAACRLCPVPFIARSAVLLFQKYNYRPGGIPSWRDLKVLVVETSLREKTCCADLSHGVGSQSRLRADKVILLL